MHPQSTSEPAPRIGKVCPQCGVAFSVTSKDRRQKHCSRPCASAARRNRPLRECAQCGAQFAVPRSFSQVYCSPACKNAAQRTTVERACLTCGIVFTAQLKRGHKYCSPECSWQGQRTLAPRTCMHCGRTFEAALRSTRKYCCHACYWADEPFLKRARERIAQLHAEQRAHPSACYTSTRGGRRSDLGGLFVRSSWEANWGRYLNMLVAQGRVLKWEYEPDSFQITDTNGSTMFYLPDFKVTNADGSIEYHEVKGWMTNQSALKLACMARCYPHVKVVLVDKQIYTSVARMVRRMIPEWEWNVKHSN